MGDDFTAVNTRVRWLLTCGIAALSFSACIVGPPKHRVLRAQVDGGQDVGSDDDLGVKPFDSGLDAAFREPFGDAAGVGVIDNGARNADAGAELLFPDEIRARLKYWATPIALSGRVVDLEGNAVAGARISLRGREIQSAADGSFVFEALSRQNVMLEIDAEGYKSELTFVHLARARSEAHVTLDATVLVPDQPSIVRFLFGGDTAFGRRFLDPREEAHPLQIPPSNPDALIDSADPAPGSIAALRLVAPLFQNADFPVVNLETPVTDRLVEYHMSKDYVFYTLPESLEVFPPLGVRYVSLGNNHVFDYLTAGLIDTLENLAAYGLVQSGAGLTVAEAFMPYRETLGSGDYSFISATSVDGIENPPLYVAAIDPVEGEKGGAADLQDTERVRAVVSAEREAGYLPIVQEHTGAEYTYWPTDYARGRMSLAVQSGAALVVSHHPHVAQGFAFEADRLIVQGLGNLCFDQARHETMLGLLSVLDYEGETLVEARAIPIYLEDYRPRPVTGDLARLLLRRVGERSENASVSVENHWGRVTQEPQAVDRRALSLRVQVDDDSRILDLRDHLLEGESLLSAELEGGNLQAGEDILIYGDFEDWDVDEENFELMRWDVTGPSSYPCLHEPRRGAAALCSFRTQYSESVSSIAFRNRVRVLGEALDMPNKDLSFVGYARGDNAGQLGIQMRYYASEGERQFGEQMVFESPGGSFDWRWFSVDLDVPPDASSGNLRINSAHAMRFFVTHAPPEEGDGIARFDDVAIVSWRPRASSLELTSTNPVQFLRLLAPEGRHTLELTLGKPRAR